MKRPDDETLLAFLEETLGEHDRAQLQRDLESDPALAAELQAMAAGLDALRAMAESRPAQPPEAAPATQVGNGRISPWWAVAVAVLALAISIPVTLAVSGGLGDTEAGAIQAGVEAPQFVLVLRGRWADGDGIDGGEFQARIDQYWAWTSQLADDGVLVATSELALAGGAAGPSVPDSDPAPQVQHPDYVVGTFTVRMSTYQEALAVARSCPHLRFGGSVTVQRVSGGFVTVSGIRDWTS